MLDRVWEQVVVRGESGVEEVLVEVRGLSRDERAALWLAAWSYPPGESDLAERRLRRTA